MTSRRDLIVLHFRPPTTHLNRVAAPDDLLLAEQVLGVLNVPAVIC